jgi:hypothetical protein
MPKSITPLSAISAVMIAMVGAGLFPAASQAQTPQMVLVATTATMVQQPATSSWGSPPINFASIKAGTFEVAPIPAPPGSEPSSPIKLVGLRMPTSPESTYIRPM